jgi:hypothetical protein
METAVLQSKSKSDLKLLVEIARKFGITIKILSEEEKEEMGLLHAMKLGRTGKYVDTDTFVKKLRK